MPLKLYKRKGSPFLYMRGTVRGQFIDESTQIAERATAEIIRARREAELIDRSVFGARTVATFAEAVVIYLRQGGEKIYLGPILELWKDKKLAKIDQTTIEAGAHKLYPSAAPSTVNRQFFTPVSAVLKAASARGLCERIEIKRPTVKDKPFNWITPEEADRLIGACSEHLRPLVVFLLYVGARSGEALWLDWRNVDLTRRHVTFPETKNGEARGVPLHPRVVAELANLPHRDGMVFLTPAGKPYHLPKGDRDRSAGSRIKTGFKGACRRAKISGFRVHDCRHTWATWHYIANRDLIALKQLGGWKSERMVLRYAHVNVAHLGPSIDALPWANSVNPKSTQEKSVVITGASK